MSGCRGSQATKSCDRFAPMASRSKWFMSRGFSRASLTHHRRPRKPTRGSSRCLLILLRAQVVLGRETAYRLLFRLVHLENTDQPRDRQQMTHALLYVEELQVSSVAPRGRISVRERAEPGAVHVRHLGHVQEDTRPSGLKAR